MYTISHTFQSVIPDDPAALAAGEVCPQSHWNANHTIAGTPFNVITYASGSGSTLAYSTDETVLLVDVSNVATFNLPANVLGTYTIKDISGNAQTNNITINGNGANIDGNASVTIGANYGSRRITGNGTVWSILG